MVKYVDKNVWVEQVLMPDESTPILGGTPDWDENNMLTGWSNVPAGQLADRTRFLKEKVEGLEQDIETGGSNALQKDNNLSDLQDVGQAKFNLGLNLVDNTRDLDKLVSDLSQEALDEKVDKEAGKGLSSNDFTTAEKNKLSGIQAGAQTNAVTSVAGKTGAVALVKDDVGLGNVDNTADSAKPVSTAQQTALNLKADLASPALTGTPTAPTAVSTTNTTQLATTAFVQAVNSSETGSAATAIKLKTARTINGTNFDGSTNITTANWGTTRTLTIGSTGKSVNGSANVVWSLAEIGATPQVLHLSGGFDFNSISGADPSTYRVVWNSGNANLVNSPNGNIAGMMFASQGSHERWNIQMFLAQGSNPEMYLRGSSDSGGTTSWGTWEKVWHSGNDGVGSGLDADLLDGQHGSYYQNASNLTTGTVPEARLPALNATKANVLNGTNNLYVSGSTYLNVISWNDMGNVSTGTSINLNTSLNHKLNVTANITLDATNVTPGKSGDIVITTPSARTVSWAAKWKFLGSVPSIGGAGETWVVSYKVFDANTIYAAAVKVA